MSFKLGASSFTTPSQGPSPSRGMSIRDVRVKDIVLGPNHPRFQEAGGWSGIGTIFFDSTTSGGQASSTGTVSLARPMFSNIKFHPLVNEIVAIIAIADPINNQNPTKKSEKLFFYLPPANVWNSPHHNALPDASVPNPLSNTKSYSQVENGAVNRGRSQEDPIVLGSTFKEKSQIFPLYAYEGDHILEGRWGNSLRFGSTVNFPDYPNNWSGEGNEGDPLTILRVSDPNASTTQAGWLPFLEDTNQDLSSIYLTSTQKIPFSPSSFKTDSFGTNDNSPISPSEYQGNQIILDSGRLVLNAKSDGVLVSSPNTIHLSAGTSVNLDCADKIVLSTKEVYLVDRNASERAVLGDALVLELKKLLPALKAVATAMTSAAAGPFPVPTLISVGPVLETAVNDLQAALNGSNPKILSKKVKLQ